MNLLIKSAEILDAHSPHHKEKLDIHIVDGVIRQIGKDLVDDASEVISGNGLKVSTGWVDMRAHFNDPGAEHKEDLDSGAEAAMAAGFTKILLMPNVNPVVDQKGGVQYISRNSKSKTIDLLPCAAVTLGAEGKDLTEMIDLQKAGAVAFSDGIETIWHTDIMLKALQYVQKFNGTLINRAEDKMLTAFAHMNEGAISTVMGLKGMPVLSETIMIERDLKLLEYAGGKLHISMVSAKESVDLIAKAKASGLQVTCDVGVNYLLYTEDDVEGYDTNLKVNPPYRTKADQQALIKGLTDGVIDAVVSDHQPHDEESKKLEFDLAEFGTNNLQGFWPILNSVFGTELDQIIPAITSNPRQIVGLEHLKIEVGAKAELTIFDGETKWTLDASTNRSKSCYSPLWNQELTGKVWAIVNQQQFELFT